MSKRNRQDSPVLRKKAKVEEETPQEDELSRLLNAVDNLKFHGRPVAPPFRQLPPRQQYPDYYELIKKPIAIDTIRDALKQGEYLTLDMLKQDLLQMTNNAKRYNEKGSFLYTDAKLIANVVKTWAGAQGVPSSSDEDEPAPVTMKQKVALILKQLHGVLDKDGRQLAEIFMVLPDREMYPDYYKIIKRPLSLKEIDKDNKRGNYKTVDKFADDLEQMYRNAFTFNEDGSLVAQDAKALKQVSDKLIADVRANVAAPPPPTIKIKVKVPVQPAQTPVQDQTQRIRMSVPAQATPTIKAEPSRAPTPVTAPASRASVEGKPQPGTPSMAPTPAPAMQRQLSLQKPIPATAPRPSTVTRATNDILPILYSNHGPSLLSSLQLATLTMAPSMHLSLPADPKQPSQIFTWTLPMAGSIVTVTPALQQPDRPVSIRLLVNRHPCHAVRRSPDGDSYEARLSTGLNCIECVAEAEALEEGGEADEEGGRTRLRAMQQQANTRRDRERFVVMVFLR